ncbi:MAG: hypothetical protein NTZ20_05615 [Candidatus Levybacteria bacterium]|nr:hypothetical protein [Candidatus Levybacteria bacterium]
MAVPTTRETFKQYCLRALGAPVIQINVDDEQLEDRIDEALKYYYDYHFDGTEKVFIKYAITDQNKTDRYLTVPENIIGVVEIFDVGSGMNSTNMFDIRYQMALNDMYNFTNSSLVPYYNMMSKIALFEEVIIGKQPIRYNRHVNKLYVDMNWAKISTGDYMVVVGYQVVNPEVYTDAWGDRWLQHYCVALFKRQWAAHLTKYSGIQLMGGISFDGQRMLTEANSEISQLESDMVDSFSLPSAYMLG